MNMYVLSKQIGLVWMICYFHFVLFFFQTVSLVLCSVRSRFILGL